MNRRKFIIAAGAAPALPLLAAIPEHAPTGGNEYLRQLRDLHPTAFLRRVCELAPAYPEKGLAMWLRTPGIISGDTLRCTGGFLTRDITETYATIEGMIPGALRYNDVSQMDPNLKVSEINYGQNIRQLDAPGDPNVYWTVGSIYARLRYVLPDGSKFVFEIGQNETGKWADGWGLTQDDDFGWGDAQALMVYGHLVDAALNACRFDTNPIPRK